ncbi:MAG: hypothetical protein HY689_03860 [Chloroflexi bacterium]|nr:hypothetical protein [Chloroflexota bacterium]
MPTRWLSYRIFMNPADPSHVGAVDDYVALLRQVVHPLLTDFAAAVKRYAFQVYAGPYGYHHEEGGVVAPLGMPPHEVVQLLRLRLEVDEDTARALHDRLDALCRAAPACRGWEVPAALYDPAAELGRRFGPTRVEAVADLLHAASRLALLFATDGQPYDPSPNAQGGSAGVMHLLSSTLRYIVPGFLFEGGMYHRMPLPCVVLDWDRELRYTSYPLP